MQIILGLEMFLGECLLFFRELGKSAFIILYLLDLVWLHLIGSQDICIVRDLDIFSKYLNLNKNYFVR